MSRQLAISPPRSQVIVRRRWAGSSLIASIIAVATDAAVCTNLPKTATTLPTYIARGDADMLVSTAWSTEAIAKMCAVGTPVHDLVVPDGHDAQAPSPISG